MFDEDEAAPSQVLNPQYEAFIRARKNYRDGISLAGGLLVHDFAFLVGLYPFLIIPALSTTLLPVLTGERVLWFSAVERLIYATFFFLVLNRWFGKFSVTHRSRVYAYLLIVAVNLMLWCVMTTLASGEMFGLPQAFEYLGLLLLIPLIGMGMRYFFYFMPAMLGDSKPGTILQQADEYTKYHLSLPVKLLIPPLLISTLYSGVVTGFSPDVRHTWVSLLLDAGDGLFWVLSCYLALGVGLSILAKNRLMITELDPYLDARLETLRLQSPSWLTGILDPAHGAKLILVSALIWIGNMIRLWELPPAPSISLAGVVVQENSDVTVTLDLKDPEYTFRGFRPIMLRIAGETGELLSGSPVESKVSGAPLDALFYYPRTGVDSKLTLTFKLINRADDFKKLEDIYLWYGNVRLAHIKPSSIQSVEAGKNVPTQHITQPNLHEA